MPSQTRYKNISAVSVIKSQTRNSSSVHQQENGLKNVVYLRNVRLSYNKKELLMPAKPWMSSTDVSEDLGDNEIHTVWCHLCKFPEQTDVRWKNRSKCSLCVRRGRRGLPRMVELFYILTDEGYAFVKTHCTVPLPFSVCWLYLKKTPVNKQKSNLSLWTDKTEKRFWREQWCPELQISLPSQL